MPLRRHGQYAVKTTIFMHVYNYWLDLPKKFMLVMLYLTRDPEVFHWTQVWHAFLGAFQTLSKHVNCQSQIRKIKITLCFSIHASQCYGYSPSTNVCKEQRRAKWNWRADSWKWCTVAFCDQDKQTISLMLCLSLWLAHKSRIVHRHDETSAVIRKEIAIYNTAE